MIIEIFIVYIIEVTEIYNHQRWQKRSIMLNYNFIIFIYKQLAMSFMSQIQSME